MPLAAASHVGLAMGGKARVGPVELLRSFVTLAIPAVLLGETITGGTLVFALAVVVVVASGRKSPAAR